MLEPLFRCNLACVGCGKIDYPDAILNRRMSRRNAGMPPTSAARRWWLSRRRAADPQGNRRDRARPGGAEEIRVALCTNALLLEKKLDLFEPSHICFSRCIWTV